MFKQLQGMIDRLNESNSNNDKIEALKHYDNMRDFLFYTYSPFKKYYITSKNIIKRGKVQEPTTQFEDAKEEDLFSILDRLDKRELSGHEALDTINNFTSKFKEHEDLIHMVIDGNLKIRMSAGSINKVFPGLIPKFDVALAKAYEPRLVNFDLFDWYASRKIDGCRCITIVKDGVVKCFSRTGNEFETLDNVKRKVILEVVDTDPNYLPSKDFVLDGEICIVDENGDEDFTSIMKEIKKKDHTIENPKYKIFDILSLDDFLAQESDEILSTRIGRYMMIDSPSGVLDPVAQHQVKNEEHLNELFAEAIAQGWEGEILRKDTKYKGKRSNDLLKLKKFHDGEYKIIGTEVGDFRIIKYDDDGKSYEDTEEMLASVIIEHKGNKVNVGSGFSIAQRQEFYKDLDSLIGVVITVQYFEETVDKSGNESLRFPTLKHIHGERRDT